MTSVLFAAAEATPFVKSGGLGEVVGSLPRSLRHIGADARVIMPLHRAVSESHRAAMTLIARITVPVGWRRQYCGLLAARHDGIPCYFVDNEYYFGRATLYGHHDEAERFAFFARAVLEALPHLNFRPAVIHCHDWHTGLIPPYLAAHYRHHPFHRDARTVFTIHNLKHQGVFPKTIMGDIVDLGWEHFTPEAIEYYDQVNYMKAALAYADRITTVSPSYAGEIRHPFNGEGLDGYLTRRGGDLAGIVNGIDCQTYDPATDPHIFRAYDETTAWRKRTNKARLQEMLGLERNAATPVVAVIARLVRQKGLDLIIRVLDDMMADGIQLVVMGDGEDWYRAFFWEAAHRYPGRVAPQLAYDEAMARRIWAAADIFLMPSLFEPCGIAQLIALRYGALPLVRETGGLRDTVIPYNRHTGAGNGFSFANYNAHEMLHVLRQALSHYNDHNVWYSLVKSAMTTDCSWQRSAGQYLDLYHQITGKEAAHAHRQERIPTGVPGQSGETARQTPRRNDRRRKVPRPEQPDSGLYWPQVAAVVPGTATGAETGLLPVY